MTDIRTRFPLAIFLLILFSLFAFPARLFAGDGDTLRVTTWVLDEYTWPETHIATFGGFPDATKRFRKVIMRYTLDCASGGCDPWDVGAPIYVDRNVGGQVQPVELGRFITPYSKTGIWEWDVTDYQSLLRDSVTLRHRNASYTSGPQGYAVTLEFIFIEGTPPRYPFAVDRLWQGGYAYGVNTTSATDFLGVDTLPSGDTVQVYDYQHFIVYDSVISFDSTIVGAGASTSNMVLAAAQPQSRSQMLWTAAELSSAGLSAGPITGLRVNVAQAGSALRNLQLRLRHTTKTAVTTTDYENGGFTLVYDQNTSPVVGWNKLAFVTPFVWNGTDNIVVDLCYDNAAPGTDNVLYTDATAFMSTTGNQDADFYMAFQDTNRVEVPDTALASLDSAITISMWVNGAFGEHPQNNSIIEAYNAAGQRVFNVHLPWGNGRVYWDAGNDAGNYDRIEDLASPDSYQASWSHWAFVKDVRTGEMTIFLNGSTFQTGSGKVRDMTGITLASIGSNAPGAGNFYDGKIDDVRIWGAALDSATINAWMHRKVNTSHPNFGDLLLNYEFDDGMGSVVTDAAGTNDGTVDGQAYWEGHGRIDPCLRHPDQVNVMMRPQVTFEQGQYVSHLDSVISDSSISLSIQTRITYNSFDSTVQALNVPIPATADQIKLRVRTSGHGFGGNLNCAEFCSRLHSIHVDGQQFHQWRVWNDKCDLNACYPQGGTWIYDRAGWCPGSFVLEQHLELGSVVNSGQAHAIDYECETYSWNGQGSRPTWDLANHLIYYEAPAFTLDAAIDDVMAPSNRYEYGRMNPICGRPKIVIQNTGTTALTSLDIHYSAGGADSVFQWTGNLDFLETEEVELGHVDWNGSTNQFMAWVASPNGGADQYATNDTFRTHFVIPDLLPRDIYLQWRTNNQASETKYQLMDADENVLYQNSPFLVSNRLYRDTFNLMPGCYIFRLWDTGEDGLSFFANNDGAGYARIHGVASGAPIEIFNADFGGEIRYQFNVDENVQVDPGTISEIAVYPNPTAGRLNVDITLPYPQAIGIEVYPLLGRRVYTEALGEVDQRIQVLDLSDHPDGMYIVKVKTPSGTVSRKVQLLR